MWPEKLIDPDGQDVVYVRCYGNQAEYRQPEGKTIWLCHNGVGEIVYGNDIYREVERPRRCVEC